MSALALVETSAATLLALAIYSYLGTLTHIAIGAALAPLLLLKTENSTKQALHFAENMVGPCMRFMEKLVKLVETPANHYAQLGIFVLVGPIWFGLILINIALIVLSKVISILYNIVFNAWASLAAIPENWRRIVLCTDSFTIPEILPDLATYTSNEESLKVILGEVVRTDRDRLGLFRVDMLFRYLSSGYLETRRKVGWFVKVTDTLGVIVMLIIVYVPAIAYRWSLKSTALLWSPLLWAVRPFATNDDLTQIAYSILNVSYYRIMRIYSAIIIGLFAIKFYIFVIWHSVMHLFTQHVSWPLIEAYLVPQRIPLWHLAAFVNACLTWWLYFESESFTKVGKTVSGVDFNLSCRTIVFIRNVLSVYVAICTVYITARLAGLFDSQPHLVFFPW